jgi:site-specific DNA-methyltransferase (adenine-specific)
VSAQTERWVVHHGDALPWLRSLDTNSVDALVTDPPAGIAFMGKDWDRDKGGRAEWVRWLAEILSSARRVLRPGAYGWVWALPRTSHWTGWACEEAGLEVRDVLTHVQAQGFPKSRALLKPGSEHWILVRKPGPLRDLRIDDCRVGTTKRVPASISRTPGSVCGGGDGIPKGDGAETIGVGGHDPNLGRWPANFALSHSADCARVGERRVRNKGGAVSPGTERAQGVAIGDLGDRPEWTPYGEGGLETVEDWECGEDCPVRALGEQSGRSRSRVGSPRRSGEPGRGYGMDKES